MEPDRWVDEHGDALYRFAMLRLRDPEAAAEVVQEAFLAALRSRDSYSGRSSERTWLIAILKHKILDHLRRKARLRRAEDDADAGSPPSFDGRAHWVDPPRRWADDAAHAAEREEFWTVFRACLAELPPLYAEAFALHELDGLSSGEICELLGITATNLNSRLHRARLLLRRALELRWFGRRSGPR